MDNNVLSGMNLTELQEVVQQLGAPRFVAKQLADWLYAKQVTDFEQMTNLPLALRQRLAEQYIIGRKPHVERLESKDGTVKYLFPTLASTTDVAEGRNSLVESVFIPTAEESEAEQSRHERGTLCVSSQVGCKMGCLFCMTGRQGFSAQLTPAEILNQVYALPEWERLTNLVFMGQGEPLDNVDAVLKACELLTAPYGLAWSPKRITVSTVGDMQGLKRLLEESSCSVAISLHFAQPELRRIYMPAERVWPIRRVVEFLRNYEFAVEGGQRRLSFEYIVFEGLNDTPEAIDALVDLLKGMRCRVNLIPFHTIPNSPFRAASETRMKALRNEITRRGVFCTLRASRGEDIMAACGLLSNAHKAANYGKEKQRGSQNK